MKNNRMHLRWVASSIDRMLKNTGVRLKLVHMLLLLTIWTSVGEVCFGQLDRASLSGTITDPSGAVVPGAQVTALQTSTQASSTTVTNDSGVYNFIGLPIGDYSVTAEITGFSKMVQTGVVLRTGASVRVDLTLAVGTNTEQVEVTATAPLVEERSAAYGVSVETKTLNQLPLQVDGGKRTPYSYLATIPGVQNAGFQNNIFGGVGMYSQVVIDGATAEYNPAVQGVMSGPPSVETLAEFKVVNSVAAEYGLSGGAFVSFATKSGTNEFHGSAFEYLRNEALDARSFFAASRPIQKQHEFGFTAGGPVYIPKLYDGRKKTFFFGSFTRFSIRNAVAGAVYTLPTEAFQKGDFSALLGAPIGTDVLGRPVQAGQIYDPSTTRPDGQGGFIRDPFPGNVIPAGRFSPVSAKFQAEFPKLTSPNQLANNYVGAGGLGERDDYSTLAKIDHLLTNGRISVSHRFSRTPSSTSSFPLPAFFGGSIGDGRNNNVRVSHNRTFGVNAINDFVFGMDRTNGRGSSNDELANGGAKIGLKGVYSPCTPTTNIAGGYPTLSTINCSQQEADTNWKFNDSFSTLVGKHSIKFGGSYYRWNANFPTATLANGEFFFNGLQTNLPGSLGGNTGFGYASFLLGEVDTANVQATQTRGLRSWYYGLYIQDEFRVSSKLTLNYGLRYEVQPQYTNPNDNASEFDPTVPNPKAGGLLGALTFLGDGPGRNGKRRFSDIYKTGFGPRFGFAYKVLSGTVVRGSYGLFQAPVSQFSGELANRQGFVPQFGVASVDGGVTAAFNWTDGFPIGRFNPDPTIDPTIANGSSTGFIGKGNAHPAQIQMLNLSIQHELPRNMLLEAAYIGNLSHHVSTGSLEQLNQLDYGKYGSLGSLLNANINSAAAINAGIKSPFPGFEGTVAQALRPYPQYQGINGITSMIGNSVYHAAQIKLQKHFSGGLSFLVGYTVSKTIADVDSTPGFFAAGVQDAYNRKAERSLTSIDFPQDLVISYAYELPFGPGKRFLSGQDVFSKHVLGGWTISGIQKYTSGAPLAIITNGRLPTTGDTLALTNLTLRPDRVLGVDARTGLSCGEMDPATDRYLVRGAFANPAPFTFGNAAPRLGDVRGCGYRNESISLAKNFAITERSRFRLGADFFNVFNRHIFGNPATNIDDLNFGTVSSAGPGRSIQLNMRIDW